MVIFQKHFFFGYVTVTTEMLLTFISTEISFLLYDGSQVAPKLT